jgi:hypothetical protein
MRKINYLGDYVCTEVDGKVIRDLRIMRVYKVLAAHITTFAHTE